MGELAYQLVSTSYFLQETGHTDLSVQLKLFVGECSYRVVSETKGFIVKNMLIEWLVKLKVLLRGKGLLSG